VLRRAPPAPWLPKEVHGQPIVATFVCHSGDIAKGEALLAPLRKRGRPVADVVTRRPYTQMQSLLDATQPKGRRYYWKSHYLAGVDARMADLAVEHARRIRSPFSAILLFQVGGALNDLPAGHSPAGNRDAAYVLNITGSWEDPAEDASHIAWARECFEATRVCSTGGTYLNFLTEEEGRDRIQAAYGAADLDRLAALKHRFDPDNLFRHTKNVAV
jgi:FAD/FMN-containing dehydrogenase